MENCVYRTVNLEIGEEQLSSLGLVNETSEKLSKVTSDVTEWLSSMLYILSAMDCHEDESLRAVTLRARMK